MIKEAMLSERLDLHQAMEEGNQDQWVIGRSAALVKELEEVESALNNQGQSTIKRQSRTIFDRLQ